MKKLIKILSILITFIALITLPAAARMNGYIAGAGAAESGGGSCSTTADFTYTTTDSYTDFASDIYTNAFCGVEWQSTNTACAVEFYISPVGTQTGISYEARIYTLDGGDLDTLIATSSSIAGTSISTGWVKFEFSEAYALNGRAIVMCRTDPGTASSSNYMTMNFTYNAGTSMNLVKFASTFGNDTNADYSLPVRTYDTE